MNLTKPAHTLILLATLATFPAWTVPSSAHADDSATIIVAQPASLTSPHACTKNLDRSVDAIIDILMRLSEVMDVNIQMTCLPWQRAMKSVRLNEIDAIIPIYRTPEREEFIAYPDEPFFSLDTVLITRADSDFTWTGDLHELEGMPINVVSGTSHGETFDNADYLDKWESSTVETMLRMVHAGRQGVGVRERDVVVPLARKLGILKDLTILDPPVTSEKVYLGFSRTPENEQLAVRFSETLKAFKQTEQYRALLCEYGLE